VVEIDSVIPHIRIEARFCAAIDDLCHCPPARHTQCALAGIVEIVRPNKEEEYMSFFNSAVDVLQTLVIAIGAGLAIWDAIIFWKVTETTIREQMGSIHMEAATKHPK